MITPELPSRRKVDKDVCLRYKDRVQKTHSFFDLKEAIFFYRKIGWYRERPFVPIYIYMYIETRGFFYALSTVFRPTEAALLRYEKFCAISNKLIKRL